MRVPRRPGESSWSRPARSASSYRRPEGQGGIYHRLIIRTRSEQDRKRTPCDFPAHRPSATCRKNRLLFARGPIRPGSPSPDRSVMQIAYLPRGRGRLLLPDARAGASEAGSREVGPELPNARQARSCDGIAPPSKKSSRPTTSAGGRRHGSPLHLGNGKRSSGRDRAAFSGRWARRES
jgi:hypothetical protein